MTTNIDHPLFQKIKKEHDLIKSYLKTIPDLVGKEAMKSCVEKLWQIVEIHHHPQEEILLFKEVLQEEKSHEGGPLCSLYFDMHLNNNPIELATKLTSMEVEIGKTQEIFYKEKSPLQIPVDEHRGGRTLLEYLKKNWDSLSEQEIKPILFKYQNLQLLHIEKEESCFFYLSARVLNQKQLDNLEQMWKNYDVNHTY